MTVELHCHSLFSVDAACTPEEMVDVVPRSPGAASVPAST